MSLSVSTGPRGRIPLPPNASKLPPLAREKLQVLIDHAETTWAAWRGANDRWLGAHEALEAARAAEEDWVAESARGGRVLSGDGAGGGLVQRDGTRLSREAQAVAAAPYRAATQAAASEELRRRAARDAASDAADPPRRLVSALEAFLAGLDGGAKLRDAPAPPIKGRADLRDQLQAARATVAGIDAERDGLRRAPPADGDTLAAIQREVAVLAARGRPDVSNVPRHGVAWPMARAEVHATAPSIIAMVPDSLAALAWIDPDGMVARLHAEARRATKESGRPPGLPHAQRAELIAKLDNQMLEAERHEEALLLLMESQGHFVPRREDCDARAVLAITEAGA